MTDTINGRTPEEIKRGLECCIAHTSCNMCPYLGTNNCMSVNTVDAISYINQLERERDAAVAEFTEFANSVAICVFCKDFKFDEPCDKGINGEDCWQWRGVQEVE